MVRIRGKDLQGNRAVVSVALKQANRAPHIDRSGSEREMQIGCAAFVVVQVNVPQAGAIAGQKLFRRALHHQQVGVPNIEVESELRQRVEQLAELARSVEVSRQV